MSGRSRSLAATLFFEAQLLRMDEVPDRAVIDLKSALGEFGDEPTQGEVFLPGPLQEPDAVLARNRLRLVPAHLARRNAARLAQPPHPIDHRTDAHAKLGRRPAPRHPTLLNRRNHPLTQIRLKSSRCSVHELIVPRRPYKIYYRIKGEEVWIVHIRDARRQPWEGTD